MTQPDYHKALIVAGLLGSVALAGDAFAEPARSRTGATETGRVSSEDIFQLYGFRRSAAVESVADLPAAERSRIESFLNERAQIEAFLARRRIKATDEAIERRLDDVRRVLAREGKSLEDATNAAGIDLNTLRSALAVPIAWNEYLRLTLTEDAIRSTFEQAPARYDGTRWKIRQLTFTRRGAQDDAIRDEAQRARSEVAAGRSQFQDYETSEEATVVVDNDGSWIRYRGDAPAPIAEWIFEADANQLSPVIETSFGFHVVELIEVEPGNLSLEDVRGRVITDLSDKLWADALSK